MGALDKHLAAALAAGHLVHVLLQFKGREVDPRVQDPDVIPNVAAVLVAHKGGILHDAQQQLPQRSTVLKGLQRHKDQIHAL